MTTTTEEAKPPPTADTAKVREHAAKELGSSWQNREAFETQIALCDTIEAQAVEIAELKSKVEAGADDSIAALQLSRRG